MNFGGTVRLNPLGVCLLIGACILLFIYMNSGSNDDARKELTSGTSINLKKLLLKAIDASVQGGWEVSKFKNDHNFHEQSKGKTKEGANDPVTDADFMSHCAMYQTMIQAFPNVKVISEEKPHKKCDMLPPHGLAITDIENYIILEDVDVSADDITVWIDPLDATQEFTENLHQYVTTMVCVAVKGAPVIGVIHQPFIDKTTWGWVGQGTSPNPMKNQKIKEKEIIVSRSHAGEVKNISLQAYGSDYTVTPAGGAGYKVLEVLSGNAAAYIHITAIKKWDVCAGDALLRSFDGQMTTIGGVQLNYSISSSVVNNDGIVAALQRQDWFREQLQKFFPRHK
ncbi:putative inositol monophosphatase 3 [Ischnura elegans]|uniref:putative inositol monophosphatase 3 n=1 Tax=Ischnura elegans TaxID=197161 RepID=UPI001ED8B31F|nr:putative inositol monophosphatase 3 [Ischnura elegans]